MSIALPQTQYPNERSLSSIDLPVSRRRFSGIHSLYDQVAVEYSRHAPKFRDDVISRPLIVELAKSIGSGLDVIDVGCGDGHISRLISSFAGRVEGIDISVPMLMQARQTSGDLRNVSFRRANFLNLEAAFPNRRFDVAIGVYAFCCVKDQNQLDWAFRSIHRILKYGGTAIIQVPDENERLSASTSKWIEEMSTAPKTTRELVLRRLKTVDDEWVQVARYYHPLGDYLNAIQRTGFHIDEIFDPRPSAEVLDKYPSLLHESEVSSSRIFVLKK
jgi:ubiquinone/menaquinone biosynthesis C-methylase UbiE